MVSFFKYRQCLITAPVVPTRKHALVHQARVYAFGAPKPPYLINQTPGEKLRHGAALLLRATPANS